jgi:hypothetical protein
MDLGEPSLHDFRGSVHEFPSTFYASGWSTIRIDGSFEQKEGSFMRGDRASSRAIDDASFSRGDGSSLWNGSRFGASGSSIENDARCIRDGTTFAGGVSVGAMGAWRLQRSLYE